MLRLLNIEFQKLRYSKSAKILMIGYFVLLTLIAVLAVVKIEWGPLNFQLADAGIFNFPFIWHGNFWLAAFLKFFLAVVIVSMTANEYANRTLKQNLIDGLSKKEFILSKFSTVVVFSLLSTVFVYILSMILGLVHSDFTEPSIIFRDHEFVLAFFVKLVAFFSFCLFLGILVKRSAFALGFLMFWWIFEWIMQGILALIEELNDITGLRESVMQFFPLESMSNLINHPIFRLEQIKEVGKQLGGQMSTDYGAHWYEFGIVFVWIAIFMYCSYALLKKRDL